LNPDAITLDIEMPEMDGLEALRRIRKQYPDVRVIMFSTLTERGASATFDALALGADDYVAKAANVGSLDRSMASLRGELIPKIKQFFLFSTEFSPSPAPERVTSIAGPPVAEFRPSGPGFRPKAVAIGVSTGGPTALGMIIPEIPADFPLPILVVQHMPPVFTRSLADRLHANSRLRVEEAADGVAVERGKVLIAPGGYHMHVKSAGGQILVKVDQSPPENSCRPAVDVLFRSVERAYGGSVISVILTGMGSDGLRGIEILKASGAYVIAQDEASSVVWGMPGAVAGAGLADVVVPLDQVVPEILRQMR
jgi:two-component system, chemotaxis family, protein-glutamate methylesterase/glutaminase